MKSDSKLLVILLTIYSIFYVILYAGYSFIIHLLHISYSWISISAILLPFILLVLLQFFLWKSTDVTVTNKSRTKRIVLALLSIIPALYCFVIVSINEYQSIFTIEKWLENPTERVHMVDDLLEKYNLVDKTKDEVITLLGRPTETAYFKKENRFVYLLGTERGLVPIDHEWLIIDFDDRDSVIKYEIVTD